MLIVSIQTYTRETTQELANRVIRNGAAMIRTDQPINVNVPIIGLKKFHGKEYYITTETKAIYDVARWANYVAIDSRKGNRELELLYAHCHTANIKIIADIEKIEDVHHILEICNKLKIIKPAFIATTFSKCNINLIKEIIAITNIPVIAEGGYVSPKDITEALQKGAIGICIGAAMDISALAEYYNSLVCIC